MSAEPSSLPQYPTRKSLRRHLLRGAAAAAILAVTALCAAGWVFSSMVLQPRRMEGQRDEYAEKRVPLEKRALLSGGGAFEVRADDGVKLAGLHFRARQDNDRFVVLLHGYGDSTLEIRKAIPLWRRLGYDVFAFDQRDSGLSSGEYITCGVRETRDLAAVMAYARSQMSPGAIAGLYGVSMGGAVALEYAGNGGACNFVVSDCPFTNFYDEARYQLDRQFPEIPSPLRPVISWTANLFVRMRAGVDLHDSCPLAVVGKIPVPVEFFCTEGDSYVPPAMTRALYARDQGPKRLCFFDKGDHTDALPDNPQEYESELRTFLAPFAPVRVAARLLPLAGRLYAGGGRP